MGMKNTLFLMGLMSISVYASEHKFQALMEIAKQRDLYFMLIAGGVGFHKLFTETNEYCKANAPFCWKVAAPLVPAAFLTGSYLYKKMKSKQRAA